MLAICVIFFNSHDIRQVLVYGVRIEIMAYRLQRCASMDNWSRLHTKLVFLCLDFTKNNEACRKKWNSIYNDYKEDKAWIWGVDPNVPRNAVGINLWMSSCLTGRMLFHMRMWCNESRWAEVHKRFGHQYHKTQEWGEHIKIFRVQAQGGQFSRTMYWSD